MKEMQAFLLCALFAPVIVAHNWLLYPQPRTPGKLYGGNSLELDNCENGDTSVPDINIFERGQQISATHTYANHYGGFVRFSLVPAGQEGSVEVMNDPTNFLKIGCHTSTCGGRIHDLTSPAYDYFAPYNLPKQNVELDFDPGPEHACSTDLTFPNTLADGSYVLQWLVYGMRGSFEPDPEAMALPFYRNCANIKISGGAPLREKPSGKAAKCAFEWKGGDRTLSQTQNVNDIQQSDLDTSQCAYWRYNAVNAFQSYYSPPNFWAMGEAGLPVHDKSALRAGPPAEVLACRDLINNVATSSETPSLANNASTSFISTSSNSSISSNDVTPGQVDLSPGTGPSSSPNIQPASKIKTNCSKKGIEKALRKRHERSFRKRVDLGKISNHAS